MRDAGRAEDRVRPDLYRLAPHLHELDHHEGHQPGDRGRHAEDQRQRDVVDAAGRLEEQEPAEHEANCAGDRERAVAHDELLGADECGGEEHQQQPGPVHGQDLGCEERDHEREDGPEKRATRGERHEPRHRPGEMPEEMEVGHEDEYR